MADVDFLNFISKYDLVFLNETWIPKRDNFVYDIDGFFCTQNSGNKSPRTTRGRSSGGLSFYCKHYLSKHVKVVEKNQRGILWVKLDGEICDSAEDVYICHMYIPPSNSNFLQSANFDFFENLESDILKYKDLGKLYITGDFNCRTSICNDFLEFDKYIGQNIPNVYTAQISGRVNKDPVIDLNGHRLLEVCITTGLLIANGRLSRDREVGQFTYCSALGQSTVDYLLLYLEDFETILNFEVLNFSEYSDHAPLTFNLKRKLKHVILNESEHR